MSENGPEPSLEELYTTTVHAVFRFFVSRVHDEETAEDLVAETFFKARRYWPPRETALLRQRAWLFRIARNLLTDHYRVMARCEEEALSDGVEGGPAGAVGSPEHADSLSIKMAFTKLSETDQTLLSLRLAGLPNREIAETLEMNEGAAAMACLRALRRLKALMETEYEPVDG